MRNPYNILMSSVLFLHSRIFQGHVSFSSLGLMRTLCQI
jgi:hypothetical protein